MSELPSYLAAAKPAPTATRAPWYKNIAPTYLGVMLWFVFWQDLVNAGAHGKAAPGGVLANGFVSAFIGLALAAALCHFLFYLVPGLLGMKTGLPLYVVGTSTYGATGGLFMPGLLMGLLQFGWLAVNAFFVAKILCMCFGWNSDPGLAHGAIATVFALSAAIIGLKGIQYVAKVATYLPLIPVIVLLVLLGTTVTGLGSFDVSKLGVNETNAKATWSNWQVIELLCIYIVGFFATAGAAGVDIASNSRNTEDVHIGGLTGILLPTVLAGEAAMLIVAGAYGAGMVQSGGSLNPVDLMPNILGSKWANIAMIALAISSLPGACFSSFIAANSFKTTMPKVNPLLSVGIGALVSVLLAVTGIAGQVASVFSVIGASFGPVCGAMAADYLLSGRKWSGPRAGFNPAGWISWIVGFAIGAFDLALKNDLVHAKWPGLYDWASTIHIPAPPVSAFVVGFVLYLVLYTIGMRTRKLAMPGVAE